MSEADKTHPDTEEVSSREIAFAGEEDTGGLSTPTSDLGSACVIGVLAIAFMVMSYRLDVPGSVYTAPGLMPFISSLSLFFMAALLGFKSLKAGGARDFVKLSREAAGSYFTSDEDRRSMLLIVIVIAYILLVGVVNFDFRLPTAIFEFRLSSYEVISVFVITLIMKLYWQASLLRCFLVSLLTIESLATIFRYGFGIIMPESF
jgi:hypothetical protein